MSLIVWYFKGQGVTGVFFQITKKYLKYLLNKYFPLEIYHFYCDIIIRSKGEKRHRKKYLF